MTSDGEFLRLLSETRGAAEVETFANGGYSPEIERVIAEVAINVLAYFPPTPGACAVMSALLAVALEKRIPLHAYVVAGCLDVAGVRVFGNHVTDWAASLSVSSASWDGHCWVVVADRIVDISVCRTAYSANSPPALARHLVAELGRGRGLALWSSPSAESAGFKYGPQYVLTQDQVDALARGARVMVEGLK